MRKPSFSPSDVLVQESSYSAYITRKRFSTDYSENQVIQVKSTSSLKLDAENDPETLLAYLLGEA